jgi:sialidase-1
MKLQTLVESMPAPASAGKPRNTEASLLVRRDGSYLLVYSEFYGGGDDDAAANIVGVVSRDGGRTWGGHRVVQPNVGGCNVMSPSLLRLHDGSVLLAYIRKDSHQSCTLFARRSEDDSETFAAATQINPWQAYMAFVNDSLVQLSGGRILCPAYFSSGPCWTPQEHFVARMCLSDDGGRSWRAAKGDVDCPERGAMEPVLVERPDGTLLMLLRTQMGCVYQSLSTDHGETWSLAAPSVLTSQEAPIAARAIPGTNRVLLVWNADYDPGARSHGGRRSPLHVAVAAADLAAPPARLPLEESATATFAYPSIAFAGDRALLTYYVGADAALIGGKTATLLSLKFRALDLAALQHAWLGGGGR